MFHLIFTEYERRNPLRFFQYSGIITPFLLGICFDILIIQKLRDLIGAVDVPFNPPEDIQPTEAYKVILYPIWPELGKNRFASPYARIFYANFITCGCYCNAVDSHRPVFLPSVLWLN